MGRNWKLLTKNFDILENQGRIGRIVLRNALRHSDVDVVAINE